MSTEELRGMMIMGESLGRRRGVEDDDEEEENEEEEIHIPPCR